MTVPTAVAGPAAPPAGGGAHLRPANALAERVTGRPHLSHGEGTCVQACHRQFAFRYVDNACPEFLPSSLVFGPAVHAALGLHLHGRLEGMTVSEDQMLAAYRGEWGRQRTEAGPDVPVRFNAGEDED